MILALAAWLGCAPLFALMFIVSNRRACAAFGRLRRELGGGEARSSSVDGHTFTVEVRDARHSVDLRRVRVARWTVGSHGGGFASNDEEEHILELELEGGERRAFLLGDAAFDSSAVTPLIERGVLPSRPRNGGRTNSGFAELLLILSALAWCGVAWLLATRLGAYAK